MAAPESSGLANWREKVANEPCTALTVPRLAGFRALVVGGVGEQWFRQGSGRWCVRSLQVPCVGPSFRAPRASLALGELARAASSWLPWGEMGESPRLGAGGDLWRGGAGCSQAPVKPGCLLRGATAPAPVQGSGTVCTGVCRHTGTEPPRPPPSAPGCAPPREQRWGCAGSSWKAPERAQGVGRDERAGHGRSALSRGLRLPRCSRSRACGHLPSAPMRWYHQMPWERGRVVAGFVRSATKRSPPTAVVMPGGVSVSPCVKLCSEVGVSSAPPREILAASPRVQSWSTWE